MKTGQITVPACLLAVVGATGVGLLALAPSKAGGDVEIASYATPLSGRTRNQKRNARLAASALDGKTIAPGATFSFNAAVQSWTRDAGFVKAPVSFDGELVRAYGGGVCQTSTALYNAALTANLPILERHPHTFRPRYAAPGRDAAVAFPGVDLRVRNPYPFPIRLRVRAAGETLRVSVLGRDKVPRARVQTVLLGVTRPQRLTRVSGFVRDASGRKVGGGRAFGRSPGSPGFRVATYRLRPVANGWKREKLSDDVYPAMNRVIALTEDETARPAD